MITTRLARYREPLRSAVITHMLLMDQTLKRMIQKIKPVIDPKSLCVLYLEKAKVEAANYIDKMVLEGRQ